MDRKIAMIPIPRSPTKQTPSMATETQIKPVPTFWWSPTTPKALTAQRPKAMAKVTAKMLARRERLIDLRWTSSDEVDALIENS